MRKSKLFENLEEVIASQIIALQGNEGTAEEQELNVKKANAIVGLAETAIKIQMAKMREMEVLHKQGYVLNPESAEELGYVKQPPKTLPPSML